jgi:uncharacterized protein (TIGR00369 family)
MLTESHSSSGLRGLLGFVVRSVAPDRVIGEMEIAPQHLNAAGLAHDGALMGFAGELGALGASANLPPACSTTTTESKTSFLRGCGPGIIRGECVPLHIGGTTMIWQTILAETAGSVVAIVTQTQMVLRGATPEPAAEEVMPANGEAGAGPRSTVAEERRAAILKAGAKVMGARGFANATMKEIASAAGMHVPTMYQYVRGKDELLFLICADCFQALNVALDAATEGKPTASARLEAAMSALVQSSEQYRSALRLITRETAVLQPPVRSRVHAEWNKFLGRFSTIIDDGVKAGEFAPIDPAMAAHLIESLCEAWAIRRFALRRHGLSNVETAIIQLVLSGIRRMESA